MASTRHHYGGWRSEAPRRDAMLQTFVIEVLNVVGVELLVHRRVGPDA
jgi:hypothetical protein